MQIEPAATGKPLVGADLRLADGMAEDSCRQPTRYSPQCERETCTAGQVVQPVRRQVESGQGEPAPSETSVEEELTLAGEAIVQPLRLGQPVG
jgi:hypothetical protein